MKFNSTMKSVGTFGEKYGTSDVQKEPMLFNCDAQFAYDNGGPITKSFLNNLPSDWHGIDLVFDSRVHMLMEGMYPCIPGFHQDDIPRGVSGQPEYENMPYKSEHILGMINAHVSPTVFALGNVIYPDPKNIDGNVYQAYDNITEDAIREGWLRVSKAHSNYLYQFDWQTLHRGSICKDSGWRWFGRVSRNTDRVKKTTNVIRTQVQVYMDTINKGW